jgi:hypothetical protein
MSHFVVINTRLVSATHLARALRDLGFPEVEVHKTAQPLIGWLGDTRQVVANVIVRRAHLSSASNDLGFVQTAAGTFDALISDFDRPRLDAAWLGRLTQRYAYHVAKDLLAAEGFAVNHDEQDASGAIHLTLRRMR